ncbi:hypothetical protein [Vibrio hepatarius]
MEAELGSIHRESWIVVGFAFGAGYTDYFINEKCEHWSLNLSWYRLSYG